MLRFFLCTIISAMCFIQAQAQVDLEPLPEDREKMVNEINDILSKQKHAHSLEVFDQFKAHIKVGRITDQLYQGIFELGNEMIAKRMKTLYFFYAFNRNGQCLC